MLCTLSVLQQYPQPQDRCAAEVAVSAAPPVPVSARLTVAAPLRDVDSLQREMGREGVSAFFILTNSRALHTEEVCTLGCPLVCPQPPLPGAPTVGPCACSDSSPPLPPALCATYCKREIASMQAGLYWA